MRGYLIKPTQEVHRTPQQETEYPVWLHNANDYDGYFYHADHLGSSNYITNLAGQITQSMVYMPFGELLADEHLNSYNTPFKFNAKEHDAESGLYYYGARYYDPKWSAWLSVDPLVEKYPNISPYAYVANNPIIYIDPDGRKIEYHKNNSISFNTGIKLRLLWHSVFGSKEVKSLIKQLRESPNIHTIIEEKNQSFLGSNVQPRSVVDYEESGLINLPNVPDYNASQEDWSTYNKIMEEHISNTPKKHLDGTGDGSYITLNYKNNETKEEKNALFLKEGFYKRNKTTKLFHELSHSGRIDTGTTKSNRREEEIEAVQFVNRNFRNDGNRREKYNDWVVPNEN